MQKKAYLPSTIEVQSTLFQIEALVVCVVCWWWVWQEEDAVGAFAGGNADGCDDAIPRFGIYRENASDGSDSLRLRHGFVPDKNKDFTLRGNSLGDILSAPYGRNIKTFGTIDIIRLIGNRAYLGGINNPWPPLYGKERLKVRFHSYARHPVQGDGIKDIHLSRRSIEIGSNSKKTIIPAASRPSARNCDRLPAWRPGRGTVRGT
ncbi:hypothetical protein BCAL_0627 [Bifidobacterium callitrichos DSM 23973]|uniref:Uncharacterized protein n=1 Tax=Bifidobacterium callitrichos DSM 23973 TaxID=1437609 RepID=A0A087A9C3_9BIFI|nr:hypothetical protein BCAL_0627 [Bifidobacterium callitrichos DSM 23973]